MLVIHIMKHLHLRQFDLNLLKALDALLAERNVTRAAERLGLTQSAMSHTLARLRAAFGDALFVRGPGGVKPTPRAEAISQSLARTLLDLTHIIQPPGTFDPLRAKRRFSIATDDYLERVLLPRLLSRLWAAAPGIDVDVVPVGDRLGESLAAGNPDLIISVSVLKRQIPGAHMEHLFDEHFVCVMREGHSLAGRKLTLDRFAALPHVLVAPQGKPGSIVDTELAKSGRRRRIAVTVPHFLAALHIVRESDVILTVGERLARHDPVGLRLYQPPLALPHFSVAAFWHDRNHMDSAHGWFRTLVAETARTI